jgi:hypothetical protein
VLRCRLIGALGVLTLSVAGCTKVVTGTATPEDDPSPPTEMPGGNDPLDELTATVALAEELGLPDVELAGLAAAPDGGARVVLIDPDAVYSVAAVDETGAWSTVEDLPQLWGVSSVGGAPDGTLVVTGSVETAGGDHGPGTMVITPAAEVSTSLLGEEVDPPDSYDVRSALSADGATLYVTVQEGPGARVLAVDPADGEVTAVADVAVDGGQEVLVRDVATSADGDVAVTVDADTENSTRTAVLVRFTAGLEPAGQVVLADEPNTAGPVDFADDGAAYTTVVAEVGGGYETRLLRVAPEADAPEVVFRRAGHDDVLDLVVDPAGEWAYLAGFSTVPLEVTPVQIASGAVGTAVELCAGYPSGVRDLVLSSDATRLWAGGWCAPADESDSWELVWAVG